MSENLQTLTGGEDDLILNYDNSNRSTCRSSVGIFRAVPITPIIPLTSERNKVNIFRISAHSVCNSPGYESNSDISWISGEQCD